MGTLHGEVFCDVADAARGIAYSSNLEERIIAYLLLTISECRSSALNQTRVGSEFSHLRPGTRIAAPSGRD